MLAFERFDVLEPITQKDEYGQKTSTFQKVGSVEVKILFAYVSELSEGMKYDFPIYRGVTLDKSLKKGYKLEGSKSFIIKYVDNTSRLSQLQLDTVL